MKKVSLSLLAFAILAVLFSASANAAGVSGGKTIDIDVKGWDGCCSFKLRDKETGDYYYAGSGTTTVAKFDGNNGKQVWKNEYGRGDIVHAAEGGSHVFIVYIDTSRDTMKTKDDHFSEIRAVSKENGQSVWTQRISERISVGNGHQIVLSSDGQIVYLMQGLDTNMYRHPELDGADMVTAFSVKDGIVLWQKEMISFGKMFAVKKMLYFAEDYSLRGNYPGRAERLHVLDETGQLKWIQAFDDFHINQDGSVHILLEDKLTLYSPQGEVEWQTTLPEGDFDIAYVDEEKVTTVVGLYLGDKYWVIKFRANGDELSLLSSGDNPEYNMYYFEEGEGAGGINYYNNNYLATGEFILYGKDPWGKILWTKNYGTEFETATRDGSGNLYVVTSKNKIDYKITLLLPTGEEVWTTTTKGRPYVTTESGKVHIWIAETPDRYQTFESSYDREKYFDIKKHWAESDIRTLIGLGIIEGFPDGTFKPNDKITKEQFVKLLVVALGKEDSERVSVPFSDVLANRWSYSVIQAAVAQNIIVSSEYGDTLKPDEAISRLEMAVMTARALELIENEEALTFADIHDIKQHKGLVGATVFAKIISGFPDQTFRPKANSTRAEAATIIVRAMNSK